MKKLLSILRILLLLCFIFVFVNLIINIFRINESKNQIETMVGKDVTYFNDEMFYHVNNYKYKDAGGVEYWINESTGKFYYLYNPSAKNCSTSISKSRAMEIAYDTAKKLDKEFFYLDTICEVMPKTFYEFVIFQVDKNGYKTGKFIIVKVSSDMVEYVSLHTDKNSADPKQGNCISEESAISLAYSKTAETELPLYYENDHLVKSSLLNIGGTWIWNVSIWEIQKDSILSKLNPIEQEKYFTCQIDGATGAILHYEWVNELEKAE